MADTPSSRTEPAIPAGHSVFGSVLYATLWVLCRTLGVSLFGFRVRFAEPVPKRGGLLVLSSHQSHLDPLLLGLASPRRLSSLARSSLFHFGPFGAVISALDAVPIDRDASMVAAMRAVIARLKKGRAVTVFPEGARTGTGQLGTFMPGFGLIAKRAGVPIMPVAIVGAYECWPRTRRFPRPGRIRLEFGRLIPAAEVEALSERELFELCVERIRELDARGRAALAGIKEPANCRPEPA
ncbi:MAG: lysophospholipid acyltransferase family protein [Planctomycetota bacterium]|jgi:1-acyl-sn-glycerol-3-phosphate acyltransferase|nr:lysophospholipid acyltransferase family protein [Planctomycetota bacterium]